MKKLSILIFVFFLLASIPAYSLLSEGDDAPNFDLLDVYGDSHKLSDYTGQVVLLDFFSLSCTNCHLISEYLESVYQDYRDQGFIIFAVDFDVNDRESLIIRYAEQYNWSFPVIFDQLGSIPTHYDYDGYLPTTYIIDRDQKIVRGFEGYHEESDLRGMLDEAFADDLETLPRVSVSTDKLVYTLNEDRMKVYLSITNPGGMKAVNLAFALNHTSEDSLQVKTWFAPDWTEQVQYFSMILDPGYILSETLMVDISIPNYEIGQPAVTEAGRYTWAAGLFNPESVKPYSGISTATVLVVEQSLKEPIVTISADQLIYVMNRDKMRVFLEIMNPGGMRTVDLVVALYHVPSGSLQPKLWFYPNWSEELQYFRMEMEPGYLMTKTRIVDTRIPSLDPDAPPIQEPGEYIWAAGFFKPESLEPLTKISTATVQVMERPMSAFPQTPLLPTVTITSDKREYTMYQDTIELSLAANNPGDDIPVDLYFVLYHIPTGQLEPRLWFFPNWSMRASATSLTLPAGFDLPTTKIMDVEVPSTMLNTPPITESGEYAFAVGLANPGTADFIGDISSVFFNVVDNPIPTY